MDFQFKNKTVVVTGGAEGIGYSIAEKISEQSAKVIIIDIDEVKGKEAIEKLGNGAVFMKFDLRTEVEAIFEEIIEKYERIDILVNNAGVNNGHFSNVIDVNFTATVSLSLKFHEHMKKNNYGTILNISSILGYRLEPFGYVYQATKAAIIAFSRSLGHKQNFEKSGVRVVAICPGFTKTNMTKQFLEGGSSIPKELLELAQSYIRQEASSVGDAAVEIIRTASSGSVWLIEGGKLEEITFQL